jgi:hypothetical protein
MKTTLPFAQYDKETNSLHILHKHIPDGVSNLYLEGQADLFCYNQGFNDGLVKGIDVTKPQTKPLSDEEILDIWYDFNNGSHDWTEYVAFARRIEAKVRGEK